MLIPRSHYALLTLLVCSHSTLTCSSSEPNEVRSYSPLIQSEYVYNSASFLQLEVINEGRDCEDSKNMSGYHALRNGTIIAQSINRFHALHKLLNIKEMDKDLAANGKWRNLIRTNRGHGLDTTKVSHEEMQLLVENVEKENRPGLRNVPIALASLPKDAPKGTARYNNQLEKIRDRLKSSPKDRGFTGIILVALETTETDKKGQTVTKNEGKWVSLVVVNKKRADHIKTGPEHYRLYFLADSTGDTTLYQDNKIIQNLIKYLEGPKATLHKLPPLVMSEHDTYKAALVRDNIIIRDVIKQLEGGKISKSKSPSLDMSKDEKERYLLWLNVEAFHARNAVTTDDALQREVNERSKKYLTVKSTPSLLRCSAYGVGAGLVLLSGYLVLKYRHAQAHVLTSADTAQA